MKDFVTYAGVALVLVGLLGLAPNGPPGTRSLDYQEECVHEGCSTEEVRELYASYNEECLHEGCSKEEILELSGRGPGMADAMLRDFQNRGWKVDLEDFSGLNCTHVGTETKCVLVTLWCWDKCQFPDGSFGGAGWYICGACFIK